MNWRTVKIHFRQHWQKYVLGFFIILTVIPLTALLFTVALPWVIYPKLDYYQKINYLTQLSMIPFWSVSSSFAGWCLSSILSTLQPDTSRTVPSIAAMAHRVIRMTAPPPDSKESVR